VVAFFDNTCEAGMMCGIAENRVPEWRATLVVCQNSRKKRVLNASAWLFWYFFAARHVEPTGRLLKLRWNYGIIEFLASRSVFSEVYREIPDRKVLAHVFSVMLCLKEDLRPLSFSKIIVFLDLYTALITDKL
jgi:hypothetical protein